MFIFFTVMPFYSSRLPPSFLFLFIDTPKESMTSLSRHILFCTKKSQSKSQLTHKTIDFIFHRPSALFSAKQPSLPVTQEPATYQGALPLPGIPPCCHASGDVGWCTILPELPSFRPALRLPAHCCPISHKDALA